MKKIYEAPEILIYNYMFDNTIAVTISDINNGGEDSTLFPES